jgi:preprotein translocase subunit SecG
MSSTLLIILTILAVILVTLIMLQKSSSIGLGAYSGSNDSLFGAKGPANFLAKLTYIVSLFFVIVILWLGYIYNQESNRSVLDDVDTSKMAPSVPEVPKDMTPVKSLEMIDENVRLNDSGFSKNYRINVLFDSGKWDIKDDYKQDLDKLVNIMKKTPNYKLYLTAHTDNVDSDSKNMMISNKRAETAKKYIVDSGIEASRVEAKGFGSSKPISSNDTQEGRQTNRRLEAKFGNLK